MSYLHDKPNKIYPILNFQIVFKSPHAPNCKQYSTQIDKGEEQTTICLKSPPHMAGQNADSVGGLDPQPTDRSLYEQKISPRALDSGGYKYVYILI